MIEMDIAVSTVCFLTLVSFVAGFIDSVAGGGGLLTIPSLLFAGIPPQFALGTNKLCGCLGTGVAVVNFARKKLVCWPLVALGLGFTLLGGVLGSRTVLAFDESTIRIVIMILLPLAALTLFWKRKPSSLAASTELQLKPLAVKIGLLCLTVGFYDGFFGPGTGTIFALGFFSVLHLDLLKATAHAKVFNFVSNMGSVAIFLYSQKILFALAIPMALANMGGNFLGSHFAMKKGEHFIRHVLVCVLVLLFGTLAFRLNRF